MTTTMLSQWLALHKVRELPIPRDLVVLHHPQQTLFDALKVLMEHHILSAPVVDEAGQLIGVVDTLDIAAYVVESAAEGIPDLKDCALDSIMGKAQRDGQSAATVRLDDALDKVCSIVAGPARRAVVLGSDRRPCSIVTQSTMLQFIMQNKEQIKALAFAGTAQQHASAGVISVVEDDSALKAFQTLLKAGVSSLVVLGENGRVITVVSATDLVVALADMEDKSSALSLLKTCSVLDFVLANRRPDLRDQWHLKLAVHPDTALSEVMTKLAITRVHRLIVTGYDRTANGVISLSDVCRALTSGLGSTAMAGGGGA